MVIKERLAVTDKSSRNDREHANDTRSGRPALLIRKDGNKKLVGREGKHDGEAAWDIDFKKDQDSKLDSDIPGCFRGACQDSEPGEGYFVSSREVY